MEELDTVRAELLQSLPGDISRARNAYRRMAQAAALKMDAKVLPPIKRRARRGFRILKA